MGSTVSLQTTLSCKAFIVSLLVNLVVTKMQAVGVAKANIKANKGVTEQGNIVIIRKFGLCLTIETSKEELCKLKAFAPIPCEFRCNVLTNSVGVNYVFL